MEKKLKGVSETWETIIKDVTFFSPLEVGKERREMVKLKKKKIVKK